MSRGLSYYLYHFDSVLAVISQNSFIGVGVNTCNQSIVYTHSTIIADGRMGQEIYSSPVMGQLIGRMLISRLLYNLMLSFL